jgi:D-glycero-alpha-D-manno-heptose-7-phosphate kinase
MRSAWPAPAPAPTPAPQLEARRHYNARVRITSSAPTRIDLAGGTLDIWPLYLFHPGAQTINVAITLHASAVITPAPGRVAIRSEDAGAALDAPGWPSLDPEGPLPLLSRLIRHFEAADLELTTRSASPIGAGIAGSSAMNVAVCGALAAWTGRELEGEPLLTVAQNIEAQTIKVPTGCQDYRPAYYGGVSAIELTTDGPSRVPLPVDPDEIASRLVLAYTGSSRDSGVNNWDVMKRHVDGDRAIFDHFERIRDIALDMRRAIERADWPGVGRSMAAEWENRRALVPGVTTAEVERLMARARAAGAIGAKLCGAGGGGCLVCIVEPSGVPAVRDALASAGARVMDCRVDMDGLRVGASDD